VWEDILPCLLVYNVRERERAPGKAIDIRYEDLIAESILIELLSLMRSGQPFCGMARRTCCSCRKRMAFEGAWSTKYSGSWGGCQSFNMHVMDFRGRRADRVQRVKNVVY
jgi:hypothetical protein